MKSKHLRNKILRYNFLKKNKFSKILKYILNNNNNSIKLKYKSLYYLRNIDGKNYNQKIVNRCNLTYRSRGVLKKFGLSRLAFKRLASSGKLIGIKKSSW